MPPYYYIFGVDEAFPVKGRKKKNFDYDSFMLKEYELRKGDYRLLDVDRRVVVPVGKTLGGVTRDDVIHR